MKKVHNLFGMLTLCLFSFSCGGNLDQNLNVLSFSAVEDRLTGSLIRIQFHAPAVDPREIGLTINRPPIDIVPNVPFIALWDDTQTLTLRPLQQLESSTRYVVRLKGDLARHSNKTEFTFVNHPLEVIDMLGVDSNGASSEPVFRLIFNQEVIASHLQDRCSIFSGSLISHTESVHAERTIHLDTPNPHMTGSEIEFRPSETLEKDHDYTLVCAGLSGAAGDSRMERNYSFDFHTHPNFDIIRFSPLGKDVWSDEVLIELTFSTPVALERARRSVSILPSVKGFERGTLDATGTVYSVEIDLAHTTDYLVVVDQNLQDAHGQCISGARQYAFSTGDAKPRLHMQSGIYAVESNGSGYPIWTRNLSHFDIECARVPKRRVTEVLTSVMDYDPWYNSSPGGDINWKKHKLRKKGSRRKVAHPKNKWHVDQVDLGSVCGRNGSEPGIYLVDVHAEQVAPNPKYSWRDPSRQRVLANVTDLGVLLKAGAQSGLAWITSLNTGEPVHNAKVTIFSPQGRWLHNTKTDSDGIAMLPGTDKLLRQPGAKQKDEFEQESWDEIDSWRSRRLIAVVENGDDIAVVDGNWSNGIQTWNFGVNTDYRGGGERIRGFILSDRGIYRPGEKVHFKGLVRRIPLSGRPELTKQRRVKIEVEDARGSVLLKKVLPLSPYGGFSFDLPLAREANLGDYFVTAKVGNQTFRESFIVEEFRKIAFQVDLESRKRHTSLGQEIILDLNARYLFGAPVSMADVSWTVFRRPHTPHFKRYPDYVFEDSAAHGYWWNDEYKEALEFVEDGMQKSNDQGRLRFSFEDEIRNLAEPQDYIVEAETRDHTGETVSARTTITAHPSEIYVGMHAQEYVQAVGMPFSINAVAISHDGTQLGQKAELSYIRERAVCETQGTHRTHRSCETVYDEIWSRKVDIPREGTASERIMPKEPGEYIIRLEAVDSRGVKVAASRRVWVLGRGEAFWSGDESARMALIPSKKSYKHGETAKLVPRSSISSPTALITLERNGIIDARVERLNLPSEGIEIPIESEHAPNVFASVAFVSGRTGTGDAKRPRFQLGIVELQVSSSDRQLALETRTDKKEYEPGEIVHGTIRVTNGDKPARAEVAIFAADEGVLKLINFRTPNPMPTFYAPWGLGVDNGTNLNRISRLNDPTVIDPDEGGDSGDASGDRIRSRFLSSAFWEPALITNEKGEISFSFPAPDNLTTFRIMAVAADARDRFGSGEHKFRVTKPLLAKPLSPRFLNSSDRVLVGISVHNRTKEAGVAVVTANFTALSSNRTKQTFHLSSGGHQEVRFSAHVLEAREAQMDFTVKMNGHKDSVRVKLPIHTPRIIERRNAGRGWTTDSVSFDSKRPIDTVPEDSVFEISVDRTGLAELKPALSELIAYPYGCLEQTLSRLIPLIQVEELATSLKLDDLRGEKLNTFLQAGTAKVLRHQKDNGHFSLWPSGQTYPHLTVYAAFGLLQAKSAGISFDESSIDRASRAIHRWINSANLSDPGDGATAAMAAYVLAKSGSPDHGLNSRLFDRRLALPIYGRAFTLAALAIGQPRDPRNNTIVDELSKIIERGAEGAYVQETHRLRHYMSSNTRSTAITLLAFLESSPNHDLVPLLAEGLRSHQKPGGGWISTQDNLFSLVALSEWAKNIRRGKVTVQLSQGAQSIAAFSLTGSEIFTESFPINHLNSEPILLKTSGRVRYSAIQVTSRKDHAAKSLSSGFSIKREYLGIDGKPVGTVKVGDLIRVKLTVTTKEDRHYVAISDPLPPGLEPHNTKLATSGEVRTSPPSSPRSYRHQWTHHELRDDRVDVFSDCMRSGKHTFEYLARALTPGSFQVPPCKAEAMYEPEIWGRSSAELFEVSK